MDCEAKWRVVVNNDVVIACPMQAEVLVTIVVQPPGADVTESRRVERAYCDLHASRLQELGFCWGTRPIPTLVRPWWERLSGWLAPAVLSGRRTHD